MNVEFRDVTSDRHDVGVQVAQLGANRGCGGVCIEVRFPNDDFEQQTPR